MSRHQMDLDALADSVMAPELEAQRAAQSRKAIAARRATNFRKVISVVILFGYGSFAAWRYFSNNEFGAFTAPVIIVLIFGVIGAWRAP